MASADSYALPLLAIALAAALIAPSAAFGDDAVGARPVPVSVAPPPPAPPAYAPTPCVRKAKVGHIVAVSGGAYAQAPGQPPRGLACDAPLYACEEIVTAPGASLAFLAGEVLVRVGEDARVTLAGTQAAPDLFVQRGALRSTDARSVGSASVQLGSRELAASASGADAELETSVAGPSRLCAYAGSAAVEVGATSRSLGAGECLAAQGGGVASLVAAKEPRLGIGATGFCALEVVRGDSPSAGAGSGLDFFTAGAAREDVPRDPCDEPGAGCDGPES